MQTLIVYGNCQAEAIAAVLQNDPLASSIFKVEYCPSFDHPDRRVRSIEPKTIAACAVLWSQHDPEPFPFSSGLSRDCLTVRFPSLDFNALWPFNCVNPYNAPQPPRYPWGDFPYGDYVIVNHVQTGQNAADILQYYLNDWEAYRPNLTRLMELERARLDARDAHCDVHMGEWVFNNYRTHRLFWTINHPTTAGLAELLRRLLRRSATVEPALLSVDPEATLRQHFNGERGPLGSISIPIHPRVAEMLNLRWYEPHEFYLVFGESYSYEEYFRTMIDRAILRRDAGNTTPL